MANNRLYIVDTTTGERFMIAKTLGNGWYMPKDTEVRFEEWCEGRDTDASYTNTPQPSKLKLETEAGSCSDSKIG